MEEVLMSFLNEQNISRQELLKKVGYAGSNSDARWLIEGKAIKLIRETVSDVYLVVQKLPLSARERINLSRYILRIISMLSINRSGIIR
jgi:hypothetical protein